MGFLRLVLLASLLSGCAGRIVGQEGPVTVILDYPQRITQFCSANLPPAKPGQYWRGCIAKKMYSPTYSDYTIFCPHNDALCLAHEFRHIIEPGFHD